MARTLKGTVVSTKMQGTIIVEVTNRVPHPLYKKLLKKSKKFKVATNGIEITLGQEVKIEETKKIAKGKYFQLVSNRKDLPAGRQGVK